MIKLLDRFLGRYEELEVIELHRINRETNEFLLVVRDCDDKYYAYKGFELGRWEQIAYLGIGYYCSKHLIRISNQVLNEAIYKRRKDPL